MNLREDLRDMIGRYGLIAVHEGIEKEMYETYSYLEQIYGELKKNSEERKKKILGTAEKSGEPEKILGTAEKSGEILEKNSEQLEEKIHEIAENSEELEGKNSEEVRKSEELGEKKVWPFIKTEVKIEEKEIAPARKKLKEQIAKRKEEINTSGLKRNEIMSKENLQKLISEGLGYTEIGRRIGRMPNTVKSYCEKYNLEIMRNVRKIIPDSLKKYLDNEENRQELINENKKLVTKLLSKKDKEWLINTNICIYGIFRKDNEECVYIGSTENFDKRVSMHKKGYEEGDTRKLYTLMKENGGIENHIYIPLEKPENEIGLSVRESLWWETMKPLGNAVNPYYTT